MRLYQACHAIVLILTGLAGSGCSIALAPPPPVSGTKVVIKYNDTTANPAGNSSAHSNMFAKDTSPPAIIIKTPKVSRAINIVQKNSTVSVTGLASSKSGISKVIVNGQEAGLDEAGNFWCDVLLKVGENKITVSATGVNKLSKVESFTVVREMNSSKPKYVAAAAEEKAAPKSYGKNYALIIGINEYVNIDKLKTATNDAKSIGNILEKNYGFEIKMVLDRAATREKILTALNYFRSKLKPDDNFLIYYAGHGYHDKVADASYWLPVDASLDNDTNWIDSRNVTDQLKRIISRHVLIVADSCYSGTLSRSVDPAFKTSDSRDNYLSKMQEKTARILISSGGNEPVSDSGGNGHSIFAEVFINALKKPDRDVFTAEELHVMHLKESVAGRAEQTPEYKVIRNSGHDGGDFIFTKKLTAVR